MKHKSCVIWSRVDQNKRVWHRQGISKPATNMTQDFNCFVISCALVTRIPCFFRGAKCRKVCIGELAVHSMTMGLYSNQITMFFWRCDFVDLCFWCFESLLKKIVTYFARRSSLIVIFARRCDPLWLDARKLCGLWSFVVNPELMSRTFKGLFCSSKCLPCSLRYPSSCWSGREK